jgi:monofunctional chorismate mutase, alpha proteobacterial type
MSDDVKAQLLEFRDSIDNIDAALVHLLAERFKITQKVGQFKAEHTLPPADKNREAAQVARLRQIAEASDLDPDFAEKILNFIVTEVVRNHERIKDQT